MKYLAIKINDLILPYNNQDELGGLIDCNVNFKIIGTICDNNQYGDNCKICKQNKKCIAKTILDSDGNKWHIIE